MIEMSYQTTFVAARLPGTSCLSALPLLRVSNLSVQFRPLSERQVVLNSLNYDLRSGRTLAIVGASGSGKTVSCRALLGLLPHSAHISGSIIVDGTELVGLNERSWHSIRGSQIGMVMQDASRALNPCMRIGRQITEAVRQHHAVSEAIATRRAVELLDCLEISDAPGRLRSYPHELSGGMLQRVAIAIALAANPRLLIADEATRSLDMRTQAHTLGLLKHLQVQLGLGLIIVSHDIRLAADFADEVLVLYAGRIVEHAPALNLAITAAMPYTRALFAARKRIAGEAPGFSTSTEWHNRGRAHLSDLCADASD